MKKIFGVFAIIILLSITGCYTVVWTPEDEFPTSTDSQQQYDGYYQPDYYGPYVQYYNYPWWMSITPPSVNAQSQSGKDRDRTSGIETGRNDNGGRPNRERDIPVTPPVSTNSGSGSTGKSSSGGNSGTTSTNTRSSDSSRDSGNGRNNDGGRSTDRGRR